MSTTETSQPTDRRTIADLLRPFRRSEIVRACGVDPATVSRWLGGAVPSEEHLPQIAQVARVSLATARRARVQTEAQR